MPAKILIILAKIAIILARNVYFRGYLLIAKYSIFRLLKEYMTKNKKRKCY
jgi:hypothetical protein